MERLDLCIAIFENMEQAKEYSKTIDWYSPVDVREDINTGKFGVYVYETEEFLDMDIEFRNCIFCQDAYYEFGPVIIELNK